MELQEITPDSGSSNASQKKKKFEVIGIRSTCGELTVFNQPLPYNLPLVHWLSKLIFSIQTTIQVEDIFMDQNLNFMSRKLFMSHLEILQGLHKLSKSSEVQEHPGLESVDHQVLHLNGCLHQKQDLVLKMYISCFHFIFLLLHICRHLQMLPKIYFNRLATLFLTKIFRGCFIIQCK